MRSSVVVVLFTLAACSGAGLTKLPPATQSAAAQAVQSLRERTIYDFKGGSDGASPQGTMIAGSSGALYGTTTYGGITGCTFDAGCGTVFKLTPNGRTYTNTVLYAFKGNSDGDGPASGVIADASGALYGTTEYGGTSGDGIVFKLTPAGSSYTETILHTFTGPDGNAPIGGLAMDASGDLFGTTLVGGSSGGSQCQTGEGCGVIFELKRSGSDYNEQTIHEFTGGRDGATPGSPPIFVGRNLYGTSSTGGGNPRCGGAPINTGCGTIYELTARGSGYHFRVVYRFTGTPNDSANAFAGLTLGRHHTLFGIGQYGGANNEGAAFVLNRSGRRYSEKLLHSFGGSGDGSYPLAALTFANGLLYGAAQYGGASNDGALFKLKPSGAETVLYSFANGVSGAYPLGGTVVGANGKLYGTASYGGTPSVNAGLAFRL